MNQPKSVPKKSNERSPRDTLIFILSAVLVVVAIVLFISNQKSEPEENVQYASNQELDDEEPGDAPQIDLEELRQRMIANPDIILIDVQERDAFIAQHIPGSINIPFEEIKTRQEEIPKNREVIISCVGTEVLPCALSTRAARELIVEGYQNLLDYRGGVTEWKDAGLPIITNKEILVRSVSVDELHTMISDREDVVVLDVRNKENYFEGRIPTAEHVEFTTIKDELVRIPKNKNVYVYDDGGNRSKLYLDELVRNGYIFVADVSNGFNAWQSEGFEVEK